jgi:hypothetical protein
MDYCKGLIKISTSIDMQVYTTANSKVFKTLSHVTKTMGSSSVFNFIYLFTAIGIAPGGSSPTLV